MFPKSPPPIPHFLPDPSGLIPQNFRNSTPRAGFSYTGVENHSQKSAMRRTILFFIVVLWCSMAFAQSTSPDALYERGMDAITGVGSSRNDTLGIDYFRRSAALGYGPAQIALGYYYETGGFIARDPGQALDLYRKAAQTGDPLAGWLAGRLLLLGTGGVADRDAAQKWLKIAANQNNPFGAYYLGRLMAERDYTKAPK